MSARAELSTMHPLEAASVGFALSPHCCLITKCVTTHLVHQGRQTGTSEAVGKKIEFQTQMI